MVISLFNNTLIEVNTKLTETQLFLAKTNVRMIDDPPYDILAIDIRYHKGLLITYHMSFLRIYDFATMTLSGSNDLVIGLSPVVAISIDHTHDIIYLVRKLNNNIEMLKF